MTREFWKELKKLWIVVIFIISITKGIKIGGPHYKYKVSNIKDISTKIIPFFQKYPLQARRSIVFEKFCKVRKANTCKTSSTNNGIEKIRDLVRDSLDAGNPHVQWGGTEVSDSNHRPSRQ